MPHASTQKLIIKLCELTALGDIQWREGRDGAVVFETEGYAVEIEGQPARLRVLNLDGNELEHVDADVLAAAPWPGGDGSFADHVSTMATQARRLARGTDHAISRILSSLSAPPAAAPVSETAEEHPAAHAGGPESEAAMAAAVADMAIRLQQADQEEPGEVAADAVAKVAPEAPVELVAEAPSTQPAVEETPEPTPVREPAPARAAPVEHFKRSTETFGRTRSFSIAGRTHHRPSPEARPVSSLGKITASGLVVPGRMNTDQTGRQDVEASVAAPEPAPPTPSAAPAPEEPTTMSQTTAPTPAPRPTPAPTSPDAYKPWI